MILLGVVQFLEQCPRARYTGDGTNITVRCCYCGDSNKSDHGHLSIKVKVGPNEAMQYRCFRADCGVKGVLTTEVLQRLGCNDPAVLTELANHNKNISGRLEKGFNGKSIRNYELVNLNKADNRDKLDYINQRLGTQLETSDLRKFRIQLSLYDFLNLNGIHRTAFPKKFCDTLDTYTIAFMSMYRDYLICRDISDDQKTGRRYTMYRTSGKPDPNDMKVYSIPTELDLLDPNPADIHVAEGPFSILGAYLHTKQKNPARNTIWLANCGFEYQNTIIHTVKQFGLLDANIHIWSDSEIPIKKYEQLYKALRHRMNVCALYVYYNAAAEDFGQPRKKIKPEIIKLV